jgi:hypothetical protein
MINSLKVFIIVELGKVNVGSQNMKIEGFHVKKVVKCKVMPPLEGFTCVK